MNYNQLVHRGEIRNCRTTPVNRDPKREESEIVIGREKSRSYVVPCSSAFRDSILELVGRRRVTAGEMARSVLLLIPQDRTRFPDPGEPAAEDRESVTLKSGQNAGKVWQRKPRLQVRMQADLAIADIRRALALALYMDRDDVELHLDKGGAAGRAGELSAAEDQIKHLRKQVHILAFDPLPKGPENRADALYVLGRPPDSNPSPAEINRRYRERAAIHHPDRADGDDKRMSQLNDAVRILRDK